MTFDDDIALAHALADAAGTVIRPYFRARFAQEAKADTSPVTQADREAEAAIRALIEQHRPGDGIIGEEYGAARADAERVWQRGGRLSSMASRRTPAPAPTCRTLCSRPRLPGSAAASTS